MACRFTDRSGLLVGTGVGVATAPQATVPWATTTPPTVSVTGLLALGVPAMVPVMTVIPAGTRALLKLCVPSVVGMFAVISPPPWEPLKAPLTAPPTRVIFTEPLTVP
jgi:hypothetical protein